MFYTRKHRYTCIDFFIIIIILQGITNQKVCQIFLDIVHYRLCPLNADLVDKIYKGIELFLLTK